MATVGIGCLVVVSIVAVAGLLGLRHGAILSEGPRGTLLRHMAVAGIAAALCAVMYLADLTGATSVTLAIANGSMVCAPGLIWAALTRVNGRMPAAVHITVGLALLVGAVTPFTDVRVSGTAKVAALLCVCLLGGLETLVSPAAALSGVRIVRAVMFGYAGFCGARLSAAAVFGYDSAFVPWGTVTQITTLVGMLCIIGIGIGSWRMAAALDAPDSPSGGGNEVRTWADGRWAAGEPLTACVLSLPDLSLIRTAHGTGRAESVENALWRAARDTAPAGCPVARVGRGRYVAVLPTDAATVGLAAELRRRFDELSPLVAYEDLPEILIERFEVTEPAAVDALVGRARTRRASRRIRVARI